MPAKEKPPGPPPPRLDAEARTGLLIEALSYIGRFRDKIVVIKFGGAAQSNPEAKATFAQDVVLLQNLGMRPVIVHGGGPEITRALKAAGIEPEFVKGLRVTTAEAAEVTEMVLSGQINKDLVTRLQAEGGLAAGISGKAGRMLRARKMAPVNGVELGFVGEIESVETTVIHSLLDSGQIPVISPISMTEDGATLNVNADSAASRIAAALSAERMIFMTDVDGVLRDGAIASTLTAAEALALIDSGVITGGMVPKVEALLHCVHHGVGSATIINGAQQHAIINELFTEEGVGTQITP